MKADPAILETASEAVPEERGLVARLRGAGQAITQRASSSLTRRIVVLNLAGLVALLVGFLYLNQFRQGLIEARVQSLLTQGEIIAGAVASSATVETDTIMIDPDRLLQMQTGDTERLIEESYSPLEFSISPERVAPLLRRLVMPTRTRARIYDREGALLLDSRSLISRGDILRFDLPPPPSGDASLMEHAWSAVRDFFRRKRVPALEEIGPSNGKTLPEVQQALAAQRSQWVRRNERDETIGSVAIPIQRLRSDRGALLVSTQGGYIDAIIPS